MTTKPLSYAQAIERLDAIVALIDSGKLDIDQLGKMVKEANELIAFCSAKLNHASEEVEKLLANENLQQ